LTITCDDGGVRRSGNSQRFLDRAFVVVHKVKSANKVSHAGLMMSTEKAEGPVHKSFVLVQGSSWRRRDAALRAVPRFGG
jgi:hypothetical protein